MGRYIAPHYLYDRLIFPNGVPNGVGPVLTMGPENTVSTRSNSQFISDLNLLTEKAEFIDSGRNFSGVLITTDIDYSNSTGEAFLMEMKGNMYGNNLPLSSIIQGYIYDNTIISTTGFSTLESFNSILATNLNGKLCFWFSKISYWQGFSVKVTGVTGAGINSKTNRVVSIIEQGTDPGGTKRVAIPITTIGTQDWTKENFVDLTSNQLAIKGDKEFYNNLSVRESTRINLKGSVDIAHYIQHFPDDTDGFGVSTGFTVKPYYNANVNWFKVDNTGAYSLGEKLITEPQLKEYYKNFNNTVSNQSMLISNGSQWTSIGNTGNDFDGELSNRTIEGTFANFNAYSDISKTLGFTLFAPTSTVQGMYYKTWYGSGQTLWKRLIDSTDIQNYTTYSFLAQNYALRAGSNATDTWVNTSYGLINNPSIPGKILNSAGNSDLISSTYGTVMGMINNEGIANGNPTNDWYHRIKMLHPNAQGYFTEIFVQMTGGSSMWIKRLEAGVPVDPIKIWDHSELNPNEINNFRYAYQNVLSDVLNYGSNSGDFTRYSKLNGTSFDRRRIGISVIDTRNTDNDFSSNGQPNFLPSGNNPNIKHSMFPLFHEVGSRSWQSSIITKGWSDSYKAWRITGPANMNNSEEDFYLGQTRSSDGAWFVERMIWTDRYFNYTNILQWNDIFNNGIRVNTVFTPNSGHGLLLSDDYPGGNSGLFDDSEQRSVAGKMGDYYHYGSNYGNYDGINFNYHTRLITVGKEITNDEDKVQIAGNLSVDAKFYTGGDIELILNPLYNENGDVRDSRNAHIYIVTGNTVKLPQKPILGQRIEIFNNSDFPIQVQHDNIGTLFSVGGFRKTTGIVYSHGFFFDEEPVKIKKFDV